MSKGYRRGNILKANCFSKSLVISGLLSIGEIIVTKRKERTAVVYIIIKTFKRSLIQRLLFYNKRWLLKKRTLRKSPTLLLLRLYLHAS